MESITWRELDVLQLMDGHHTNKEIALMLSISEETVKKHAANIYGKLKAEGQPIERIIDHGISLGIYLRDPDGNGVEVFYEMPRAEWPVDYNVFTREKTGTGRFPGPWDAEVSRAPARPQAAE